MKTRRAAVLSVLVTAVVLAIAPAAFAWQQNRSSGPDRLTTQQWILSRAIEVAAAEGVAWVDPAAALPVVGHPDTRLRDFRYHVYHPASPNFGRAQLRTAMYFELMRTALDRGDPALASRYLGLLTHYYSDACNPLHTAASSRERPWVHRRFERPIAQLLANSKTNRVQRQVASPRARDVDADIAAFTVLSAREARRDYRLVVNAVRRNGLNKAAARAAGRAVNRAVEGVAGMIVAAARDDGVAALSERPVRESSPAVLSQHKSVSVSSQNLLYHPARFANDGDSGSWWAAATSDHPQWWQVDLGGTQDIGSLRTEWYQGKTRSYKYIVQVSADGERWTTVADRSARTAFGASTDKLSGVNGRHLRVTVLGYTPSRKNVPDKGGPAGIRECTAFAPVAAEPVPAPSPTPEPTPTVDAIVVAGTSATAIDAAFAKATRGDTVHFPAGVYSRGTLNVPDGLRVTGAGIASTRLNFGITFGSDSSISDLFVAAPNNGVAVRNREGAANTALTRIRFRGGGPKPGVTYSAASTTYVSYNPVMQLGGKGTKRSASRITFTDCEFERPNGSYISKYVRANTVSMWEDNRAGYAHLEYLTFTRCHFGVKNATGAFGAISANIELKTNSQSSLPDFSHNWHDVVLRDCIFERSGEFNIDFTDSARDWLKSRGMTESGTTNGVPNWMLVPMKYHAGNETGRSVSVIGGEIKGAGYSFSDWAYVFCLENPIGATLTGTRIWGGARTKPHPESASSACGPILASPLPLWSLPLAYDKRGMNAVYNYTYYPGVWGKYTPSPYDP